MQYGVKFDDDDAAVFWYVDEQLKLVNENEEEKRMIKLEEIKEMQDKLNRMIEEYHNQSQNIIAKWEKDWKPLLEEDFYIINSANEVDEDTYYEPSYLEFFERNRVFKSEELAEKWLEIDKYIRKRSFKPNWEDKEQAKYYIYYSYYDKGFDVQVSRLEDSFKPFYFETEKKAREILERYSEEELKFYFNI